MATTTPKLKFDRFDSFTDYVYANGVHVGVVQSDGTLWHAFNVNGNRVGDPRAHRDTAALLLIGG